MGLYFNPFRSCRSAVLLLAVSASVAGSHFSTAKLTPNFLSADQQLKRGVVKLLQQPQEQVFTFGKLHTAVGLSQLLQLHTAPKNDTHGHMDPRRIPDHRTGPDPRTRMEFPDTPTSPRDEERTAGKGSFSQLFCISACSLIIGLVLSHEFVVMYNGESPLTCGLTVRAHRHGIRICYLLFFVFLNMDPAVLIPTSYELGAKMGCSPAVSGVLVSVGFLSTPIGSIGGAMLYKRCSCQTVRLIAMGGVFVLMLQNLIVAITLDSRDDHGPETMWFIIAVRSLGGVLGKFALIVTYIAYNVTPSSGKGELSLKVTVVTNLGFCLGPLLTATSIHLMGGREAVPSVFSRTSAQVYWMALLFAICLCVLALRIPPDFKALLPDEQQPGPSTGDEIDDAASSATDETARSTVVSIEDRKSVVFQGLLFTMERALTVAAIEAGTAMLLETAYGWSTRAIGFSISAVFASTICLCFVIMMLFRNNVIADVHGLVTMAVISCLGAVLLFDFQLHGELHGALSILMADLLMYPFMFACSGVVDGVVTRLAVPDSWYSLESYLGAKNSLLGFMRFFAFPLARYLLDTGGRNLYACLMLTLTSLGLLSSLKIAYTYDWKHRKAF